MLKSLRPDTNTVVVVGKTAAGKEIGYREVGKNCFKEICFKDGGQVPKELGGYWTDIMRMKAAIGTYIRQTEEKAKAEKPLAGKKVDKVKKAS